MRTSATAFLLQASVGLANLHDTIFPSKSPTASRDPWQCTTETLQQYFDPPKPTGSLMSALQSYNMELVKGCTPTGTNAYGIEVCTFPEPSRWCAFSTVAPSPVLTAYSTYASQASSWWKARSSRAVSLAEECPYGWFKNMLAMPGGAAWLNQTIILGECYAEAHPTSDTATTVTPAPTATTGIGVSNTGPKPTAAKTSNPNGVLGRAANTEMWMVASAGLAAAAMNTMM